MIKHAFHSAIVDDADATKIQPQRDWNVPHIIEVLSADPVSPTAGALWMLAVGTTPTRSLELKFCDPVDSVIVTLFSVVR